ncbi:MAG: lamin tail domain-containing protein [Bacteroidota bacterium]
MMKKLLLLIPVFAISALGSFAQVTENFTDGDFTANPVWTGSAGKWIVNSSNQLQSNDNVGGTTYYISTSSTLASSAQWEFWMNLKFSVSNLNYVDVFLTASANDLTSSATTGYFVRVGLATREISLYRKDGAVSVKIIDGADNIVASSNSSNRIKVVRNASDQWVLSRDNTGGTNYAVEGTVSDNTYLTSSFFGFSVTQSTATTPRLNHFFDDIVVQAYVPDVTAPTITSSTVTSSSTLDVLFNEPLDATSAGVVTNYTVNNSIGNPSSIIVDGSNSALVHLTFTGSFADATANQLTVTGVKDISGNAISGGTTSFTYFAPFVANQYDVVIDEIMADETPPVGLPEREWIELKNTTTSAINITGWRIKDGSGISGAFPTFTLAPGAYVILCSSTAAPDLATYGATLSPASFPGLTNTGEPLTLVNENGLVIHSVNYNLSWYHDAAKEDGGWTMEMINTKSPCSGISNWKASTDVKGGTPGAVNSVDGGTADAIGPKLLNVSVTDPTHVTIFFDETLDSLKAATIANYTLTGGVTIVSATTIAPLFDAVSLELSTPLVTGTSYTITAIAATGITDCLGNAVSTNNTANILLPSPPAHYDLVVNEIFFDPISSINAEPPGEDYVEIYNRSNKVIDLSKIYLANRSSSTGRVGTLYQISSTGRLMQPGTYIVVTRDPAIVQRDFIVQDPNALIQISSLPTTGLYANDKGYVILCTVDTMIIDEIAYSDKWHFKLIDNKEGVALERINYDDTTRDNPATLENEQSLNWHSAASTVGFGTPTYKNSQYRLDAQAEGEVTTNLKIFSPDNDGIDDELVINYKFPDAGYVTKFTIFDASGRTVVFTTQLIAGVDGKIKWDGLSAKGQKLPVGIYIIYTEIFNLQGKKKTFKNPVVLARRI